MKKLDRIQLYDSMKGERGWISAPERIAGTSNVTFKNGSVESVPKSNIYEKVVPKGGGRRM